MTDLTKRCPSCFETKPHDMFKMKKGKPTYCKICWNAKMRGRRNRSLKITDLSCMSDEDKKQRRAVMKKISNQRRLSENRKYIWELLIRSSCADCGCTDPLVMQFDHRDPSTKAADVSELMLATPTKLKEEVDKCDIVCAHCHIHRTAKMFGSWRLSYMLGT